MDRSARTACWSNHYLSAEGHEAASKNSPEYGEFCEEEMRDEDYDKSFSAKRLMLAVAEDTQWVMTKAGVIYDIVYEAAIEPVMDILGV